MVGQWRAVVMVRAVAVAAVHDVEMKYKLYMLYI